LISNNPEASRQQAINSWLEILKLDLEESVTGKQILKILRLGHSKDTEAALALESVELSCRIKSANTLTMRAASLGQLLNWCIKNGIVPLPIREEVVFDYLRSDEMSKRGPTNASSLTEALNFSGAVFGLGGAFNASTSSRVKGAAVDKFLKKNPRQPAKELTDIQVFGLERFIADKNSDPALRVAAGSLLFLVYGRCRVSDICRILKLETDISESGSGFIEAKAKSVKNAKTAELKTQLLPIVVPVKGLGFDCFGQWWQHFEEARDAVGLPPLDQGNEKVILWPKQDTTGAWTEIQTTAEDHSIALRNILTLQGWGDDSIAGISSHSCKATLLSCCAKFGIDEDSRRILGYHLSKGSTTVKTYSRDVMVAPLRELARVLNDIKSGLFRPSGPRSAMFPEDDDGEVTSIKIRFYAFMGQVTASRLEEEVGNDSDLDEDPESDYLPEASFQEIGADDDPQTDDGFAAEAPSVRDLVEDELGLLEGQELNQAALAKQGEKSAEADLESSSDSSSSSSSSRSEAPSETFEILASGSCVDVVPGVGSQSNPQLELNDLFKVRGGKFHYASLASDTHFRCGTAMTARAFRQVTSPSFLSPKCMRCFKPS